MVERPKLLIADELSLGLAPIVVEELYQRLGELRDQGTALLIVEQQVAHALQLCDHVILLSHGAISWQGPSDDAGGVLTGALGSAG
jgi:branched-chain amino acid transport system ATP-binding protein